MRITMNKRVRAHRRSLRDAGLRPIRIGVPDTRGAGFGEECIRQSQFIRASHMEGAMLDFIESATDLDDGN